MGPHATQLTTVTEPGYDYGREMQVREGISCARRVGGQEKPAVRHVGSVLIVPPQESLAKPLGTSRGFENGAYKVIGSEFFYPRGRFKSAGCLRIETIQAVRAKCHYSDVIGWVIGVFLFLSSLVRRKVEDLYWGCCCVLLWRSGTACILVMSCTLSLLQQTLQNRGWRLEKSNAY